MEQAYKIAALAVLERLAEQHPEDYTILRSIMPGQVAVFSGTFDQAEQVLAKLGVPVVMNPGERQLMRASVAFANCSNTYSSVLLAGAADYVARGGWLVSSDWSLHYVIERSFPDTIRWTQRSTGEEIVGVEPGLNSLWSNVVVLGADPQWWLWGSYPIQVVDSGRVKIEAASHELLRRYDAPVVAVRFDWERGHVFHVISHFWAKRSAAPTVRHDSSYVDFLHAGMKLSDYAIERVIKRSRVATNEVNFAMLQSAVTATELVAGLCIQALRDGSPPVAAGRTLLQRLFAGVQ
jgi:hypothetical protein